MEIPRLRLNSFLEDSSYGTTSSFLKLLAKHSYVVLTDISEGVRFYVEYEQAFEQCFADPRLLNEDCERVERFKGPVSALKVIQLFIYNSFL